MNNGHNLILIISFPYRCLSCFTIEINKGISGYIMIYMDIGSYLCSRMNGGYFPCFDRQDAITSEKYFTANTKRTFSSTIIVGTFCSSSKIHLFSCYGADNTGSGVFGFRIFPEMRFFDFATDDTSLFED